MASDWIKSRDGEFQAQAESLIEIIANHQEVWGLSRGDIAPLKQSKARFDAALGAQAEKAVAYHAAVAEKQAMREELERTLRAMVRRINNHPGMTEELRRRMELASPTRAASREGMREEVTR